MSVLNAGEGRSVAEPGACCHQGHERALLSNLKAFRERFQKMSRSLLFLWKHSQHPSRSDRFPSCCDLGSEQKWTEEKENYDNHKSKHVEAHPVAGSDALAAAAANSLQLCLTLCDPIDGSPPGSPVLGILQARTLEWVLLGIHLDKTIIQKDTGSPMFIAALFTIAKTWKQPKCLLTAEWIKKM